MSDPAGRLHLVLTGVRSRSHLVYASSYLRHVLESQGRPLTLTVLPTGTALGEGTAREAAVEALLVCDPRLEVRFRDTVDWSADVSRTTQLLCIGAPSVRALTSFARAHRGRRPRVVVVDEGLGSYGTWATRRGAYVREGGGEPRSTVRAVAVASSARWLTNERWSLYARGRSGWHVDERVAREFRLRLDGAPPEAGTAVYLTQPWTAIGVLTYDAYVEHLAQVRGAVASQGMRLVLRPHPWERPDAYAGFELVEGELPAELDRRIAAADVVIGGNSTALLNLAAVHRTPAVRVRVPGLAALDAALARRQRSLLDTFLPGALAATELGHTLSHVRDLGRAKGTDRS